MNRLFLLLALLIIYSCDRQHRPQSARQSKINHKTNDRVIATKPQLLEFFVDSVDVGRKKHDKIELKRYTIGDSNYVVIKFFSRKGNTWLIKNEFHFPKDPVISCDLQTPDLNNDGFNDVTYVSDRAARSANEVRKLFIYDRKNDCLTFIKNSSDYPNMLYNKELHCIDAFLISGCNVTVFLKLEADTLRQFASVNQCDSLTVSVYDKKGNEKVILKKETNHDGFTRFKNYHPLKEYKESDFPSDK